MVAVIGVQPALYGAHDALLLGSLVCLLVPGSLGTLEKRKKVECIS
jgi:hypothetical protein